jgi:uncharacterized phage-associated protein
VLDVYGELDGWQLSDLAREEHPWIEARGDTPTGAASREPLNLAAMREFFGSLIETDG